MPLRNFRCQLAAIAYQRPKPTALSNSLSTVAAMLPGIPIALWRAGSISAPMHAAAFPPLHLGRLAWVPAARLG